MHQNRIEFYDCTSLLFPFLLPCLPPFPFRFSPFLIRPYIFPTILSSDPCPVVHSSLLLFFFSFPSTPPLISLLLRYSPNAITSVKYVLCNFSRNIFPYAGSFPLPFIWDWWIKKVKVNVVDLYRTSTRSVSKALRYSKARYSMHCQGIRHFFKAHPGTHLPTPEWWKAE